ncbi:hypothetical protein CVIRNUC_008270 [Coccomyxa viridis]|uniref:Secreted protein n=1 Tax=Coccomyxa viridis TaxID=1274662 RepID=A0AAV1IF42_9CHLO|nr:hypothetical protein CVIRNUC_008270 [Coccomyxa viridis]
MMKILQTLFFEQLSKHVAWCLPRHTCKAAVCGCHTQSLSCVSYPEFHGLHEWLCAKQSTAMALSSHAAECSRATIGTVISAGNVQAGAPSHEAFFDPDRT